VVLVDNNRRSGDVPVKMHDWWHDGVAFRVVDLAVQAASLGEHRVAVLAGLPGEQRQQ